MLLPESTDNPAEQFQPEERAMSTRSVVETYMNKMCSGDFGGAFELFHPDGKYTITGSTPVSKTYNGVKEIGEGLGPLLSDGFKTLPVIKLHELIIDGTRGVALASGTAEGRYGPYVQKHYAFVFRVENEKVTELTEFMDTTQLHTQVYGQKLSPVPA
jgi:hypothetical protein